MTNALYVQNAAIPNANPTRMVCRELRKASGMYLA